MSSSKQVGGTPAGSEEKTSKAAGKKPQPAVQWLGPAAAAGGADADPFVNGTKLNNNAVSFSPRKSSPLAYLNSTSEVDTPVASSAAGQSKQPQRDATEKTNGKQPVGHGASSAPPRVVFTTDVGPGVNVPGGHYLRIDGVSRDQVDRSWKNICEEMGWEKKTIGYHMAGGEKIFTAYLCFDDIRDAAIAIEQVDMIAQGWDAKYISQTEYAAVVKAGPGGVQKISTAFYDGQIVLTAVHDGSDEERNVQGLYNWIKGNAAAFGDVLAIEASELQEDVMQYRIEFYTISAAADMGAEASEPGNEFESWRVTGRQMQDYNAAPSPKAQQAKDGTPQKAINCEKLPVNSPTGRTAWTQDEDGNLVAAEGVKQLPKCQSIAFGVSLTPPGHQLRAGSDPAPVTPAAGGYPGIPMPLRSASWTQETASTSPQPCTTPQPRRRKPDVGPNRIDVERIKLGYDVRTTVMLRNIPNEMDLKRLLEVLDKHVRGRYSFVYLRFDFNKNQNVGYAFVDVLDPQDVLTLYYAIEGHEYIEGMGRHPRHGPRHGEVAYATVQGQDGAIEKFRNSSIMCEFVGYRPKLFWTVNDAPSREMIGKERDFPGINNQSKHNRSKDNAAQIGLYAPKSKHGVVFARNSQYDRGTTAQMQEDAMFQQQQMVPYGYHFGGQNPNYVFGQPQMNVPLMSPQGFPSMMYGPPSPYFYGAAMPMVPEHGPMPNGYFNNANHSPTGAVQPSRLRTLTNGRLHTPRRQNRLAPTRTLEEAIAQNEENERQVAAYDAMMAARAQGPPEDSPRSQGSDVPRYVNGTTYYGDYTNGGAYLNGGYSNDVSLNGTYHNGAYTNGEAATSAYANGSHIKGMSESSTQKGFYNSNNYEFHGPQNNS